MKNIRNTMRLYKNEMGNKEVGKFFNILYDILDDEVYGYAAVGIIPTDHGKTVRGVLKLRLSEYHSEKKIREMIDKCLESYGNAPQKLREIRKYLKRMGALVMDESINIFFNRETKELDWRVLWGDSWVNVAGELVARYEMGDAIYLEDVFDGL